MVLCGVAAAQEPCGKLEAAADPTGRDHALGISRQWDYCALAGLPGELEPRCSCAPGNRISGR